MRTILGVSVIESVDDFLQDSSLANDFYTWSGEKDSDFVNEPERAERCHEAASWGGDGKTHAEAIEDFREFGERLLSDAERAIDRASDESDLWDTDPAAAERQLDAAMAELEGCRAAFAADVDATEQWHESHGTLGEMIG